MKKNSLDANSFSMITNKKKPHLAYILTEKSKTIPSKQNPKLHSLKQKPKSNPGKRTPGYYPPKDKDKPKYPKNRRITLPKLFAKKILLNGDHFEVTVFNSGTSACHNAKCKLYTCSLWMFHIHETDSASLAIGALEEVIIRIGHIQGNVYDFLFASYLAVVYDPISDPFPLNDIGSYLWSGTNVLVNSIYPPSRVLLDDHGWKEYSYRNNSTTPVRAENKTWKGRESNVSIPIDGLPHFRLRAQKDTYFFAGSTESRVSELWQIVSINNLPSHDLILQTFQGNHMTVILRWMQNTWHQDPPDEGKIRLELYDGNSPSMQPFESQFASPMQWQTTEAIISDIGSVNNMTLKLIAKRNTGNHNDAYFCGIQLLLKHRQIVRTHSSFPSLPLI